MGKTAQAAAEAAQELGPSQLHGVHHHGKSPGATAEVQGPVGLGRQHCWLQHGVGAGPASPAEGILGRCQLQTNPFYLLAQVLMP